MTEIVEKTARLSVNERVARIASQYGDVVDVTRSVAFDRTPRVVVHSERSSVLLCSPERANTEVALRRETSIAVPLQGLCEDGLLFERVVPIEEIAGRPLSTQWFSALKGRCDVVLQTMPRRVFFERLTNDKSLTRVLRDRASSRSKVDRFLDGEEELAFLTGPSLGAEPFFVREAEVDGTPELRVLSVLPGSENGFPTLDLGRLAFTHMELALSLHRELGGNDRALELAQMALLCRLDEGTGGDLEEAFAREFSRGAAVRTTRLEVRRASLLPPSLFAPLGIVDVQHAADIRRRWDGLWVGGEQTMVLTDPPIDKAPYRPARGRGRDRKIAIFSRFFRGIRVDEEGLFSATETALADELASGLSGHVFDATAGLGCISLALLRQKEVTKVTAAEMDGGRWSMLKHNLEVIYSDVSNQRVECLCADALKLLNGCPTFDAVVCDPPWGGRDYSSVDVLRLHDLPLLEAVLGLWAGPTVLKLPRNFAVRDLPDFSFVPAIDDEGVLKFLIARRGIGHRLERRPVL